jgi:hypothetical protein
MSELSLQFVLDKSIDALTKIAALAEAVNRESTRTDSVEDDIRLVSKDLAEAEVRLTATINDGLERLRSDIEADARQAAADKMAARTERANFINGIIHGVVGGGAGVLFTVLTSWAASWAGHLLHPTQ